MSIDNITYEATILLEAIDEMYEQLGFTLGKTTIVNHCLGRKCKTNHEEELTQLRYYGKLKGFSQIYLNNVVEYMIQNNYFTYIPTMTSGHVLMIGDAGREALTHHTDICVETDHLYNKKLIYTNILQFDPTLYQVIFDYCNNASLARDLATYMPDNIEEISKYIISDIKQENRDSIEADKLQLILQKYLTKQEPQYLNLSFDDNIEDTNIFYKLIISNLDKIKLEDDMSFNNFIYYICYSLGIYSNINDINYVKAKFEEKLLKITKINIPVDVLQQLLE